jgi:dihydroorotase
LPPPDATQPAAGAGTPHGRWADSPAGHDRRRPPTLLVRGGTIVDAHGTREGDVMVQDGVIVSAGPRIASGPAGTGVLEAQGCLVAPGLVDLHTHLREPGREQAETVETGSRAAALGGYTAVLAMPNTEPAIDSAAVVRQVLEAGRDALCDVAVSGCITVGRAGTQLAPMAEMAALGVRIFTDDGTGVQDARLMRRALEYASSLGVILAQHCEDASLAAGGHMHEGEWSSRLGIPGQPSEAEELMVMRDLALCRLTGTPVHFLHLSTAGAIAMVRGAKASGLPVTAEATPHHLVLTDACVAGYDTVFKVNPPLRTDADVAAVRAGLADGTIDAIATDHAPHPQEAKEAPFDQAPPGMTGLETALAVAFTELELPPERILALMSWQPARIAGLSRHGQPVEAGAPANLCVIDPAATWTVDADRMASRSRNTPFAGRQLTGKVRHTVLDGEPVVIDGEAQR